MVDGVNVGPWALDGRGRELTKLMMAKEGQSC